MSEPLTESSVDGTLASSNNAAPQRSLRILILTPSLPYPPIWGFGIRVYQFIRILARRHQVSVLAYREPGEDDKVAALEALGGVTVHTVLRAPVSNRSKRIDQSLSMFSPRSYQRRSLFTPEMQAKLAELSASEHFDVIQIESSQLAGYVFDRRAVVVVDEHNIEYELLYRMYETEGSAVRRFYNWLEYAKFKREEVGTWRSVDGCVMTSSREENIMRSLAPGRLSIVGANAVDVDYFSPSPDPPDGDALVMTGLMHYRPNIDGAIWFLHEIFPRILEARPRSVFYIVGAGATDELKRFASANVVVTGTVPDVRPYAHRAAVFVVPLRMGGGTRLKVLEGLSMQKAVVSTTVGCEGLDVTDGEDLIVADEPQVFADAVVRLANDRARATRLGRAGRGLVARNYKWESVVERLEQFYGRLLASRGRPSSAKP